MFNFNQTSYFGSVHVFPEFKDTYRTNETNKKAGTGDVAAWTTGQSAFGDFSGLQPCCGCWRAFFQVCQSSTLWLIYSPQSWIESFRCHNADRVALWRRRSFPGGTDGYAPSQIVLGEMRGGGVECVVVVLICMGWEGLLFAEFEEIKALFVLRGKGEWVQLCRLLSYKERLSGLWWSSWLSNFDWFSFATH